LPNLQLIATQGFCTKNMHKHKYKLQKMIFLDEICGFFCENHGKLEMKKNSVIDGQIVIIQALMGESI